MADAKKCDRCGVLFVPKVDDLVIFELSRCVLPDKNDEDRGRGRLHHETLFDEEDPCDLCTNCSDELREFLKPIKRRT